MSHVEKILADLDLPIDLPSLAIVCTEAQRECRPGLRVVLGR